GVDIFHASTRRFWEPEFEGSDLNLAGWTQKLSGKPTMSVGSVGLTEDFISGTFASKQEAVEQSGIDELVERMTKGEFDLIAVGRAWLQDTEWLVKVKEGRLNEVEAFAKKALTKLYCSSLRSCLAARLRARGFFVSQSYPTRNRRGIQRRYDEGRSSRCVKRSSIWLCCVISGWQASPCC